jgi:hypothetical protein
MHEVLHIIGLCPDSFAHFDLIDLIVANYENLMYIKTNRRWLTKNHIGR